MVKFLLERPVAVLMTFLALIIVGAATFMALPVSLLPDIDIPKITVRVSGDNVSAREFENTVVAPLRRQLMQVGGLRDIKSDTRDGSATITLDMDYGVDTDLAFIEANEKIDAAMAYLPKDTQRPKVIKASATSIPVLYLNMTLKADRAGEPGDNEAFFKLGDMAENLVRRRLEQLPEVAMADMTGIPAHYLRVTPDMRRLGEAGVTVRDVEQALVANNVDAGNMTVRDGYYQYNISVPNMLTTAADVGDIYLRKADRVMQLKELCDISVEPRTGGGYSLYEGKRAVTLALIKHDAETMDAFKSAVNGVVAHFSEIYPDIEFNISRNQTELLDYSIDNLEMNLVMGLLLVFFVCALFMGDMRSPLVIGINIIVAIVLTFLFFYLMKVSVNIISLAGLILAVGMMIDNSVIVTENITQYTRRGYTLMRSCELGTNEMITPMLSSSLTTVAVFVPLVFMSGIAGAIFADQAFSITAGLAASYIVGITLLPVLYMLFYRSKFRRKEAAQTPVQVNPSADGESETRFTRWLLKAYDHGIDHVFRHPVAWTVFLLLTLPMCAWLAGELPHQRIPDLDGTEKLMRVDWNDNIDLAENLRRVDSLTTLLAPPHGAVRQHSAYVGVQDFMLDSDVENSTTEAEIYVNAFTSDSVATVESLLADAVRSGYPEATFGFSTPGTIFDRIFGDDEAMIEARIYPADRSAPPGFSRYNAIRDEIGKVASVTLSPLPARSQVNLTVDRHKLLLYNVDFNEVQRALSTAFRGNSVTTLRSFQRYMPVEVTVDAPDVEQTLLNTMVNTGADATGVSHQIPLSAFVTVTRGNDLKTIDAGNTGEYVMVELNPSDGKDVPAIMDGIQQVVDSADEFEVEFAGSYFSNNRMLRELLVILLVSLLLIYFILCAQFESFLQPLIVLLEIPVDTAFALLALWLCGDSLNIMSAIGIVVTAGIVVNDSILKLDAINELRKSGMPLLEAIHTAGRRRLRAIIMTSLTTIIAMVPVLFTSDMGSQLQRPLAIAMIASMVAGTLVSIFLIPLVYWLIYRRNESKKKTAAA